MNEEQDITDEEVKLPDNWGEIMERTCRNFARAQNLAHEQQDEEFKQLIDEKQRSLRCIGCGKEIEWVQWGDDDSQGYFYGGGLLCDRMGYGSCRHDMAMVAVLVCDDCVAEKGISSDWLDKLHVHFEAEVKKARDNG